MDIQSYLDQVFKRTFLSKRERTDLAEEMAAHLHSSKEHYMNEGCTDEQAATKAIASFGDSITIRTKLTQATYGLSSKLILRFITISFLLYLSSLFTGIILHYYDVHNRAIELFPVVFITLCAMSSALLLTRKNTDRWCLLSVPILFGLGYLQAYLGLFKNRLGGADSFTLFENLFFSGAYDFSGRSSFHVYRWSDPSSSNTHFVYFQQKPLYFFDAFCIPHSLHRISHGCFWTILYVHWR
ncbi:permease prefix domain 1-containing protein [Paenibacillus sp. AN1007]|uniref:Permease prefix domain 1-containing protein n=1 Tax=Paenibacillus sp. AN1007 TaxID=3151385 RepID=A0AAU8N7J6_9BACL